MLWGFSALPSDITSAPLRSLRGFHQSLPHKHDVCETCDITGKERDWEGIAEAAADAGVGQEDLARFGTWRRAHGVNLKKHDAGRLIAGMLAAAPAFERPFEPRFSFVSTNFWRSLTDGAFEEDGNRA